MLISKWNFQKIIDWIIRTHFFLLRLRLFLSFEFDKSWWTFLDGFEEAIPWLMLGFVDLALTFPFTLLSFSAISKRSPKAYMLLSSESLSGSIPRANLIYLLPTGHPGLLTTSPKIFTSVSLLSRIRSHLSFLLLLWLSFFFLKYSGKGFYSAIIASFLYYSISYLNLSLSALSSFHYGEWTVNTLTLYLGLALILSLLKIYAGKDIEFLTGNTLLGP